MAEDESHGLVLVEELRLVSHDELIRIIVIGGCTAGVFESVVLALAALEYREVGPPVVNRLTRQQLGPLGALISLLPEEFVEPLHKDTIGGVVVVTLAEEAGDLVDEEQAEHLDPVLAQHRLLPQVLANRLANHLPVDRVVRTANGLPGLQPAVGEQLDRLGLDAELVDTPAFVGGVAGDDGEVLAVLHCDRLPLNGTVRLLAHGEFHASHEALFVTH